MSEALAREAKVLLNKLRKPIQGVRLTDVIWPKGTLKRSTQRFRQNILKARLTIGLVTMLVGFALLVASVFSMIATGRVLNWLILLAVGGLLCVAGFVLLVTELLESWLSRGQKGLVDGLQAG
jgi:vacuolar-type H+-ATPase subunit I/STV1